MQNFFAKVVAVAMLVGGFSFTGDLGWIADKGQKVLGAADIPNQLDVTPVPAIPSTVAESQTPHATETAPAAPAAVAAPQAPADPEPQREFGGPEPMGARFKPPVGGPEELAWKALGAGSRVVIWLAGPPYRCLVIDFVDPTTGEALLYDVATVDADSRPLTTAGPPRRVIIGRDEAGHPHGTGIVRGGLIHVAQTGIAPHAGGQWLGPVAAITFGP
jgi:hypothetical protein